MWTILVLNQLFDWTTFFKFLEVPTVHVNKLRLFLVTYIPIFEPITYPTTMMRYVLRHSQGFNQYDNKWNDF